jgi:hypothetical protein
VLIHPYAQETFIGKGIALAAATKRKKRLDLLAGVGKIVCSPNEKKQTCYWNIPHCLDNRCHDGILLNSCCRHMAVCRF